MAAIGILGRAADAGSACASTTTLAHPGDQTHNAQAERNNEQQQLRPIPLGVRTAHPQRVGDQAADKTYPQVLDDEQGAQQAQDGDDPRQAGVEG